MFYQPKSIAFHTIDAHITCYAVSKQSNRLILSQYFYVKTHIILFLIIGPLLLKIYLYLPSLIANASKSTLLDLLPKYSNNKLQIIADKTIFVRLLIDEQIEKD